MFTPEEESENLKAYGPFKSAAAAKSWMAQEFDQCYEAIKEDINFHHWEWNDKGLGSCKLESIGIWEVVKNSK